MGRRFCAWLGLLVVVAAISVAIWERHSRKKAEDDLGLASSRMIDITFEKAASLKVGSISGKVVARSQACRLGGTICSRQITRAPASVDYFVDLANLPVSAYRWNGSAKTMTVDLPPIIRGKPNVDMSQAEVQQGGLWITRSMGAEMNKLAAKRLTDRAAYQAALPSNMARMERHAQDAMQTVVSGPLRSAGLVGVIVVVRLPGEAKPAALSQEVWDMSKPLREVLAELR